MAEPGSPSQNFVVLAALYWVSLSLAAIFFYFYVLFPVWLVFAYWAVRTARTPWETKPARILAVVVIIWILAVVPLFFYIIVVYPIVFVGMASSMILGTVVVYSSGRLASGGKPVTQSLLRLGLLAGLATPVLFLASQLYGLLTNPRSILTVGPPSALQLLELAALAVAMVSGAAFFAAARRLRGTAAL